MNFYHVNTVPNNINVTALYTDFQYITAFAHSYKHQIQQGITGEQLVEFQPNQTVINTAGKQGRDDTCSIKLFSIQPHPTYLFPYIPFICRNCTLSCFMLLSLPCFTAFCCSAIHKSRDIINVFVSAPECRDIETALYDRTCVRPSVRTYVRL